MNAPMTPEQRAAANRAAMPKVAAIVDDFRKEFGADQITVTYASEAGREIGSKA